MKHTIAFLVALVFALTIALIAEFSSPYSIQPITDQQSEARTPANEQPKSFGFVLIHDPVAAFTGFLAVSTGLLWWVTRTAANAANASVNLARDEFNAAHRPKIRIKHVWLENEMLDDEPLMIELVFTNIGDSPARIHSWGITTIIIPTGDYIPPRLVYLVRVPHPQQTSIMQSGVTFQWANIDVGRVLSHAEAITVRETRQSLYCIGHVEYMDITSTPRFRRTNFCRILQMPPERGLDRDVSRFRVFKDPDYEYED